jgi:hypothetical protein
MPPKQKKDDKKELPVESVETVETTVDVEPAETPKDTLTSEASTRAPMEIIDMLLRQSGLGMSMSMGNGSDDRHPDILELVEEEAEAEAEAEGEGMEDDNDDNEEEDLDMDYDNPYDVLFTSSGESIADVLSGIRGELSTLNKVIFSFRKKASK